VLGYADRCLEAISEDGVITEVIISAVSSKNPSGL
jgi:hypothetical protein